MGDLTGPLTTATDETSSQVHESIRHPGSQSEASHIPSNVPELTHSIASESLGAVGESECIP